MLSWAFLCAPPDHANLGRSSCRARHMQGSVPGLGFQPWGRRAGLGSSRECPDRVERREKPWSYLLLGLPGLRTPRVRSHLAPASEAEHAGWEEAPRCSTRRAGKRSSVDREGTTPGASPGAPPAAASAGMELQGAFPPSQPGRERRFGCLAALPSPAGARVGHAGLVRWKSHLVLWPRCPCPSQERWEGVMASPQAWPEAVPVQQPLPHTQGPRRAFKMPFITMEPSRLKSPSRGLGVGFWCGRLREWDWDWDGVRVFFFFFFA